MTDTFINAWCVEHGYSSKVGVIISYLNFDEKDLIGNESICENYDEIMIDDMSYTVYDTNDVDYFIKDEEDNQREELLNGLRGYSYLDNYIDWDAYFDNYPIEFEDLLKEEGFSKYMFDNRCFYIKKESL